MFSIKTPTVQKSTIEMNTLKSEQRVKNCLDAKLRSLKWR